MGLILDSGVFIRAERKDQPLDFSPWVAYGDVGISVVTASELLIGVHRADKEARRAKRSAFVEAIIGRVPILDFTLKVARLHADLFARLSKKGQMIGAHDLLIAATALSYGYALLTTNAQEFRRVDGLIVLEFS